MVIFRQTVETLHIDAVHQFPLFLRPGDLTVVGIFFDKGVQLFCSQRCPFAVAVTIFGKFCVEICQLNVGVPCRVCLRMQFHDRLQFIHGRDGISAVHAHDGEAEPCHRSFRGAGGMFQGKTVGVFHPVFVMDERKPGDRGILVAVKKRIADLIHAGHDPGVINAVDMFIHQPFQTIQFLAEESSFPVVPCCTDQGVGFRNRIGGIEFHRHIFFCSVVKIFFFFILFGIPECVQSFPFVRKKRKREKYPNCDAENFCQFL